LSATPAVHYVARHRSTVPEQPEERDVLTPAEQYHVGIVVADLDAEAERLTSLLGHEWTDEVAMRIPVRFADTGDTEVNIRLRYSRTAPRLELIQQQPGTVWMPVPGSGLHHLGFWSDDLDADGSALTSRGYAFEAEGRDPQGRVIWSYWGSATGPRVELVDRSVAPFLAALWGDKEVA
jgi:hypothetical protein